ncbi:peptidase M48-like protein [Plasticicumulans lactativorans]|uniref:Peptidase M48-like protein n=1 Tax=Plasticicumulans lactativorans TaxID=1133106 RepID=A0A4R2L957_9GAMM|nr:M48 family metalloprotease [Plasticicumulans lactativorans]TCO83679.1 peptidase M48-like protein [Plasticicumulans lactativorans]
MRRRLLPLVLTLALGACATEPPAPPVGTAMSTAQIDAAGVAVLDRILTGVRPARDLAMNRFVRCVADALIQQLPDDPSRWQVIVIDDPAANVVALPGRGLVVSAGLLTLVRHEKGIFGKIANAFESRPESAVPYDQEPMAGAIAHTLAHYASAQAAQQAAGSALGEEMRRLLATGRDGYPPSYDREQEAATDRAAFALMARAGFHPRGMLALWQDFDTATTMDYAQGLRAPRFLGVHPLDRARLKALEAGAAQALPAYDEAGGQGHRPACG